MGPVSADEAALVARSREGDLSAFNALVEMYQGQVYNLCLRMLASAEAAEDAAQDTFLSAYRSIGRYRGPVFRAWLLRIAVNACTDELRRRRRRPQVSLDAATPEGSAALELPDSSDLPEERALRSETLRDLQAALMRLPIDQRAAIVLCDVQGFSYEEISASLGVSLGTVKSRISRGRSRLRRLLTQQGELLTALHRHSIEAGIAEETDGV
ncbi:MAG: sigma-70 family RNA polymerase sigma factor [Dehalococcoidia bacterium]|nr:sigma-70 family RNA polymerase sigma factor [Dehalococcoidia bacterium]